MAEPTPGAGRRRPVSFRPRTTLMVLYLLGFFVLFAFLIAVPDLIEAARSLGPGPEELTEAERQRAAEIGRQAIQGKVYWAALAAAAAVTLGAYSKVLPGLRER